MRLVESCFAGCARWGTHHLVIIFSCYLPPRHLDANSIELALKCRVLAKFWVEILDAHLAEFGLCA